MSDNGQQAPPWAQLPPEQWIGHLQQRLANMATELAMKDAYIDQLHQALAQVAEQRPALD